MFFKKNACRTNPPFNVTVNSHDTPANPPRFHIFFQGKRVSQQPFQIPCVFSSKARLACNVTVNLYVMWPIAPKFDVFFQRKCASQECCRIPRVHFLVFSQVKCVLGLQMIANSYMMLRTDPGLLIFFQGKRASQEGICRGYCHCKISFGPKTERRPNVDKGVLQVNAMLGSLTFQCYKTLVARVRKSNVRLLCLSQFFKTRVTPHPKIGMSKVAYHRMFVGGLEVVKCAKC